MKRQKKIHSAWQREYRKQCHARQGEVIFQVLLAESDLQVLAHKHLAQEMLQSLGRLHADLRVWMGLYPQFRTSLEPLPMPKNAPDIVLRMYTAAQSVGVGPFAAVAGSISQMLAELHVHESADLIVENGGDVYLYSQKERVVGILSDPEHEASLGLILRKEDFPLALCSSSATIGHSLSLGQGELALVRAKDAALADALATALGNRLRSAKDIEMVLEFGQSIEGIDGILVQCDAALGVWGNMELVGI